MYMCKILLSLFPVKTRIIEKKSGRWKLTGVPGNIVIPGQIILLFFPVTLFEVTFEFSTLPSRLLFRVRV